MMAKFLLFVLGCWCLISTAFIYGLMRVKEYSDSEGVTVLIFIIQWSISVMGFIFAWKAVMG